MKLLDAKIENTYLVIETDQGRRFRKIGERDDAKKLLNWAQGFIGKNIKTTTWSDWDESKWFATISEIKEPNKALTTKIPAPMEQSNNMPTQEANQLSISELLKKAEAGEASAQFLLAQKFEKGLGVPKSLKTALQWYQQAADQGHVEAAKELGIDPLPIASAPATRSVTKIYGPPGTGKTTTLIALVIQAIDNGISHHDIGYFSYTNQATQEAKNRIFGKFPKFDPADCFPYFQTLHSLAYRSLQTNIKILTEQEARGFDDAVVIDRPMMREGDESSRVVRVKHPILDAASTARAIKQPLSEYLTQLPESQRWPLNKWFGKKFKDWTTPLLKDEIKEIIEYNARYERYKKTLGVIDYADILDIAIQQQRGLPEFKLLIVDEAQDLTPVQWDLVKKLSSQAEETFIAGDDDQAICEAFGARASEFVGLIATQDDKVLEQSHRVPGAIFEKLPPLLDKLDNFYPYRKQKRWKPKEGDHKGYFLYTEDLNAVLRVIQNNNKNPDKSIFIIAPTNATLKSFSTTLTNESIDHYLSNEAIGANPKNVRLQTAWGAKGGEADIAILINESDTDFKMLREDPRLEYVAITRAKNTFIYLQLHKERKNPFTCFPHTTKSS